MYRTTEWKGSGSQQPWHIFDIYVPISTAAEPSCVAHQRQPVPLRRYTDQHGPFNVVRSVGLELCCWVSKLGHAGLLSGIRRWEVSSHAGKGLFLGPPHAGLLPVVS